MAHGITLEMQQFDKTMRLRTTEDREPVKRDRSLRGKKRIRARKAANKQS